MPRGLPRGLALRQYVLHPAPCTPHAGKHVQAAKNFERAGLWGEAGDQYHRHCGEGLKAAECYERAGRWEDAARRYDISLCMRSMRSSRNSGTQSPGKHLYCVWYTVECFGQGYNVMGFD